VDLDEFRFREKPDFLLKQLKIDADDKILLCVANFVPIKGISTLLSAFDVMSKEHSKLKLVIVGDYNNPHGSEVLPKFTHLINENKLILPGKINDTKYFYNMADFFILPTGAKGEGTSVAILEAMASGCVVLASKVAGNKDQLRFLSGQLFNPENPHCLVDKIKEYLSKPDDEISEIIKKQKDIVNKYYGLRDEIEKHEQFYLEILNRD
jgi:glycosyltransferase involved in cell wall biosynthesis